MSGAFRAYEDLCCVYLDAQFNFRDPHMNQQYGITHGSPHFLLFQKNLREVCLLRDLFSRGLNFAGKMAVKSVEFNSRENVCRKNYVKKMEIA